MHVAVDVHYWEADDRAWAAVVGFADWADGHAALEDVREHCGLAPYQPGEFYRRELPCLLPLLGGVAKSAQLHTVVVDGYVDLGRGRAGLGRYLWEALGRNLDVIGVAKSPYVGADAVEVCRGGSERPLWVTATGDVTTAAANVARMHGDYRIPTLIKRADQLARQR